MRILIQLIFLSSTLNAFGQTDARCQTVAEHVLGIAALDDLNTEFEIRLVIDHQLSTRDEFIWIRNSGETWQGQSIRFEMDYPDNGLKIQKSNGEKIYKEWGVRFQEVLSGHFSEITDQKDLMAELMKDYENRNGEGARFMVKDRRSYCLAVKVGDDITIFKMHSPWAYLEEFPNSKTLKWYCDILDLIDKTVKIKVRG